METNINIPQSNFNVIQRPCFIVVNGKRGSGKTNWAQHICTQRKFGRNIAICGNKECYLEWCEVMPRLFVHMKQDGLAILQRVITYQEKKVTEFNTAGTPFPKEYNLRIILDDCGSVSSFINNTIIRDIGCNGRHYKMEVVVITQKLTQICPQIRDNLDLICILQCSNTQNAKRIFDEYIRVCDERVFNAILNTATSNHGMLLIDNVSNSLAIHDVLSYCRIDYPREIVQIGSQPYVEFGTTYDRRNIQQVIDETHDTKRPVDTVQVVDKQKNQVEICFE